MKQQNKKMNVVAAAAGRRDGLGTAAHWTPYLWRVHHFELPPPPPIASNIFIGRDMI